MDKAPMKFLVTGGAGFIGSALVRYLINETSHEVVNVDKLTYAGNLDSLTNIQESPRYFFEEVDICNEREIFRVFCEYKPDFVIHLAAESHVDRSIDDPSDFVMTNIVGTYTLLRQALSYWRDLSRPQRERFRFHHVSTDEVYGDLPHPDFCDGELPLFTEVTPYAPSSPYSASKASSDHLVRAWHRTYGLPTIITNCSNNYGPFQFPEKLIPRIIINALSEEPLPVYGKGNQIRDWLYVDDHVKALVKVATDGHIGATYNIGGLNERRNIDVVTTICEILDQLVPKHSSYTDLICHVEDRPGHDMRYAMDAAKIKSDLGWIPQETFETGMRKTIEWYLENQAWWRRVQSGKYQRQGLGDLGTGERK